MFYEGPPGIMVDLAEPSPTGVDLLYSHQYVYAINNPVNAVDPSGLFTAWQCAHVPGKFCIIPNPDYRPTVNGCGKQGSWFKPPDRIFQADFRPCCDNHDRCYGTCQLSKYGCCDKPSYPHGSKEHCDDDFLSCMEHVCRTVYRGSKMALCLKAANGYFKAVQNSGIGAYKDGQNLACTCGPCPCKR